jgi:hypothetical protein
MTQNATNPARAGNAVTGLGDAFTGGNCSFEITPKVFAKQALIDASVEEIRCLFSELMTRCETGILYCDLLDYRGLKYAVNTSVAVAVRLGDEFHQMAALRKEDSQ